GNLRIKQALEKVATAGDCRQAAGEILQQNKR
ncbi:type-F conjugative transfer system pilin assembly protein TrbC, partial [Salmonella enterica subsp. enterica serovar Give]|nr:type-F conjugative transfer system pilin assembly protein TrbC [Salmonella enterica subsp. enterica serovar Give]